MSMLEYLEEHGCSESLLFDNPSYDTAIVGLTSDSRVVYDYDLMVRYLVETDNMDEEDAADFIDYNTIRSLQYIENAPVVMHKIDLDQTN